MASIDCSQISFPEYTFSLLFWIGPGIAITAFLARKKLLGRVQVRAMLITVGVLTPVGFVLDLAFGHLFLLFPCESTTLGIAPFGIPIEEFIFYITGFWFIVLLYIYGDEYFLARYNKDDAKYRHHARGLVRKIELELNRGLLVAVLASIPALWLIRRWLVPDEWGYPGYAWFLVLVAYAPFVLFWRITRSFVNRRAMAMTMLVTTLVSVVWEVTLALPRGYWNYQSEAMLGLRLGAWHDIPAEAVTVWVFSSLTVLIYEYVKIAIFARREGNAAFYRRGRR